MRKDLRDLTKQDFDEMTVEEREEIKRQAAGALASRFVTLFALKLSISFALRRWMKKLGDS